MSKLFWCDYFISCWNYEKRLIIDTDTETSIKKKMMDFDLYEEYLTAMHGYT